MSDDLSRLTPTDPSNVDPAWGTKRDSILDDVLADGPRSNRSIGRWVAGGAAAAVIMVGAGIVVGQLGSEPSAVPASPSASVSPIEADELVAAGGTLIDVGDGITLCTGGVEVSHPPRCVASIPVSGITWDDLDWVSSFEDTSWAEVTLVGTFDQTTFAATRVYTPHASAAPPRPIIEAEHEYEPLCSDPVEGYGASSSEEGMDSILDDLPGFQIEWPSLDPDFTNVAVTGNVTRAREILEVSWDEPFCVGTLDGPTNTVMTAATDRLWTFAEGSGQLTYFGSTVKGKSHRLDVTALLATPAFLSELEQIVGPDVWPFTTVSSLFYPVEGSATRDSTPSATSSPGTGTTTTSAFTVEQRGWAEEVVGDVLRSVGQPGKPAVTARMAKVTYGQYMSVWNIDIPEPPGPTPDDAEILVVALSASLDGSSMHAGPPSLTTPDPTTSQTPREPIGTVTVLDPSTGESLSHATVLGGDPPADLIMNLPGPIEDVALPQAFR